MVDAVGEALGVKKEKDESGDTAADADGDDAGDAGADGDDAGDDAAGDDGDGEAHADEAAADGGGEDAGAGDDDGSGGGKGKDAGAEGAEGEDESDADPFAPPKGLKERSAERWGGLVERVKKAETTVGSFQKALTDTGASREDISRALYTLRLVNRGGPDGAREALKILDGMRAGIAKRLGVEVPGVDLLSDYPDLAKAVENAEMTREHALEIAGGRRIRFETTEAQRRANDDSQRQAQVQQQRDAAFKELDTLGDELGKTDVEYDAKFGLLKSNGDIQDIVQNFPPAKWAEQFRRRYNLLGKAGGVKQRTAKPAHQPLRSSGTGGGGNAAPKSLLDAVMQGVESADE